MIANVCAQVGPRGLALVTDKRSTDEGDNIGAQVGPCGLAPSSTHRIIVMSDVIPLSVDAPVSMHASGVSNLTNITSRVSQAPNVASDSTFPEFDFIFSDSGTDNARVQLPSPAQLTVINTRSTSGNVINSFSAKRKRAISVPHHVVLNRHFNSLKVARPTDEPIESFTAKRKRIDHVYVMTRCHATDAPT